MVFILTKKLLQVDISGDRIKPRYRDPDLNIEKARRVLNEFKEGRKKGEIESSVKSMENHKDFKFLRGLHALIERRCGFDVEAEIPPRDIRRDLFEKGIVTDKSERNKAMDDIADSYNVELEDLDRWFWADRKDMEILQTDVGRDPKKLVKQYNLSATQTLFFDALEITFNVSNNYKEIFGMLKYLGLMYTVNKNLDITVTGPSSLFKKTRKYGNQLARLLPYIMRSDRWSVKAKIERDQNEDPKIYEFKLTHEKEDIFPYLEAEDEESFDSEVERDLATRLEKIKPEWEIKREPTIIKSGNSVMIPDFSFERFGKSFYLEVVGFWTPDYLEKKIRKVKNMEADKPVVLAVNKSLKCTKEDFNSAESVFFYDKRIPLKKIISRMEELEEEVIYEKTKEIDVQDIVESRSLVDLEKKAEKKQVPIETIKKKIDKEPGVVCENKYLPENKLKEIKKEIDQLETKKLPKVKKLLDCYGLSESSLEKLGYTAKWGSFNPNDVKVIKK